MSISMRSPGWLLCLCLLALAPLHTALSQSFHLDVVVRAENGRLVADFCGSPELGCDTLPVLAELGLDPSQLPIDTRTGGPIFLSDFGDFAGGQYSTDDPGFQALVGALPPNRLLSYEALDVLSYWDPALEEWTSAIADGTRVRLFGGLPADAISTDPAVCGGLPFCLIGTAGSTTFTGNGIGNPAMVIDNTSADGALHAHLDWFVESSVGVAGGARGAYLVNMRLTATGFQPSHTFVVMLNRGLSNQELGRAILARMAPDPTVTAVAGVGGSISPASAVVPRGETTSFVVIPATGHGIANVQGCGGALVGNRFTTAAVTSDCTVEASFSLNQYTIGASAGAGGSISPASVLLNHGETGEFVVTPAAGYTIESIEGCNGTLVGSVYTTGTITGACAIVASFRAATGATEHLVTATASGGGTISPSSIMVRGGDNTTFTVTPAAGYRIADVHGCDGSLTENEYTTATINGSCEVVASFVLEGPVFDSASIAAFDLDATGVLTELPSDITPRATDHNGNPLPVTLASGGNRFAPGEHVLTWRAVDASGVAVTAEQVLRVWPIVSLGQDVNVGFQRGNSAALRILLNGRSPRYPLTVSYAVSGYLQNHNLVSGSTTFLEGEVEREVWFTVIDAPPAGTPDQQITVALSGLNARPLTVNLRTANVAAAVAISGQQDGEIRSVFSRAHGAIVLTADVRDPNGSDAHSVVWHAPSGAVVATSGASLTLQPQSLPVGIHRFEAVVTDSGAPPLVTRGVLDIVLRDDAVALPEGAQYWAANGLPEHPRYNPATRNILPQRAQELSGFLIEVAPGLQLGLGAYALSAGRFQAGLTQQDLPADSVRNVGGYVDFVVHGLALPGQTIAVVIAQVAQVPTDAVYRKLDRISGRWSNFIEDGANSLASAPGGEGLCPPPGSDQYRAGLHVGDWCVRLSVNDGGSNDADREINGVYMDPGGVATNPVAETSPQSRDRIRGGRGSIDLFLLLSGLLLAALRRKQLAAPMERSCRAATK